MAYKIICAADIFQMEDEILMFHMAQYRKAWQTDLIASL